MMSPERRIFLVLLSLAAFSLVVWPYLPVKDPESYFKFADTRSWEGIPNLMDVLSNLIFLWVGFLFIKKSNLSSTKKPKVFSFLGLLLGGGCVLTCLGSAYFHWHPTPETLVWDRLPMTLVFASISGLAVADRSRPVTALTITAGSVILGLISVIGMSQDWLSLKLYFVLQFGTLLFLVVLVSLLPGERIKSRFWWIALELYFIAKICELQDRRIFDLTTALSGHTLKHFLAGLSLWTIAKAFDDV